MCSGCTVECPTTKGVSKNNIELKSPCFTNASTILFEVIHYHSQITKREKMSPSKFLNDLHRNLLFMQYYVTATATKRKML